MFGEGYTLKNGRDPIREMPLTTIFKMAASNSEKNNFVLFVATYICVVYQIVVL